MLRKAELINTVHTQLLSCYPVSLPGFGKPQGVSDWSLTSFFLFAPHHLSSFNKVILMSHLEQWMKEPSSVNSLLIFLCWYS